MKLSIAAPPFHAPRPDSPTRCRKVFLASSRAASVFSGTASASAMSFASPSGKVLARNSTFPLAHKSLMARMRAIKALSQRPSCFASNSKALTPPAASSLSTGPTSGRAVRPNQSPAISTTTTPRSPRRAVSRGGIASETLTLTSDQIKAEPLAPIDAQPGRRRNPVHRRGGRRSGGLRGVTHVSIFPARISALERGFIVVGVSHRAFGQLHLLARHFLVRFEMASMDQQSERLSRAFLVRAERGKGLHHRGPVWRTRYVHIHVPRIWSEEATTFKACDATAIGTVTDVSKGESGPRRSLGFPGKRWGGPYV